jgi:hypothetical protein
MSFDSFGMVARVAVTVDMVSFNLVESELSATANPPPVVCGRAAELCSFAGRLDRSLLPGKGARRVGPMRL